jgi:hypothetical protein
MTEYNQLLYLGSVPNELYKTLCQLVLTLASRLLLPAYKHKKFFKEQKFLSFESLSLNTEAGHMKFNECES